MVTAVTVEQFYSFSLKVTVFIKFINTESFHLFSCPLCSAAGPAVSLMSLFKVFHFKPL